MSLTTHIDYLLLVCLSACLLRGGNYINDLIKRRSTKFKTFQICRNFDGIFDPGKQSRGQCDQLLELKMAQLCFTRIIKTFLHLY